MGLILDDKSEHCIPFILKCLAAHQQANVTSKPFFVGLQGVQGAGKTTLVETLCQTLTSSPHNLKCVVLSIDDLYLPHAAQVELAKTHSSNTLIQHRGQPGTHDVELGNQLFQNIADRKHNIRLPAYDKSAFGGAGDRCPDDTWTEINISKEDVAEVIIFEGWCVGFRALDVDDLEKKWSTARRRAEEERESYHGQLGRVSFDSIQFINEQLTRYDLLTDKLDCFVQIDAEDTFYVYQWRAEQEIALRASKGRGMTDEQVREFVDGYYPAYELYGDRLRDGIFNAKGKQLRLVVNRQRKVVFAQEI